jgi:adenylyl- and sulfurtransferase ThiI
MRYGADDVHRRARETSGVVSRSQLKRAETDLFVVGRQELPQHRLRHSAAVEAQRVNGGVSLDSIAMKRRFDDLVVENTDLVVAGCSEPFRAPVRIGVIQELCDLLFTGFALDGLLCFLARRLLQR